MSPEPPLPIDRAIAGDADALALLWRAHRGWLTSVLLCHAPHGADLEDLLQEVALRLVREIGRLQNAAAFRGWLRVVALNVARSAGRASASRPATALDPESAAQLAARDGVDERAEAHERLDRTLAAIESLPPSEREALLLKSVHGFTQRRIATTLGVPVTAVESRLARARRMLRQHLRRRDTDDARPGHRACSRARGRHAESGLRLAGAGALEPRAPAPRAPHPRAPQPRAPDPGTPGAGAPVAPGPRAQAPTREPPTPWKPDESKN